MTTDALHATIAASPQAIIFDFDGLLVDTEWAIYQSWARVYEREGHTLPLDLFNSCLGSGYTHWNPGEHLETLTGKTYDWPAIDDLRQTEIVRDLEHEGLLPGALELLDHCAACGIRSPSPPPPRAAGSAAGWKNSASSTASGASSAARTATPSNPRRTSFWPRSNALVLRRTEHSSSKTRATAPSPPGRPASPASSSPTASPATPTSAPPPPARTASTASIAGLPNSRKHAQRDADTKIPSKRAGTILPFFVQ